MCKSVAGYLAVIVVVITLPRASGQEVPASPRSGSDASAVTVPFFVQDRQSNPITIAPSELTILDNKVPPKSVLSVRPASELPLRLGLLIDASNSQRNSKLYRPLLAAATELLHQLVAGPEDRAFVATFDNVPHATPFMDHDQAQKFGSTVRIGGGTALYDAVLWACRDRMKPEPITSARRILIVLSDGEDNLSHVTLAQAIASALEAGTVVFAISTDENQSGLDMRGEKTLKELAWETGGDVFLRFSPKDIPKVFDKLKAEIAAMYAVTYIPAEPRKAGQFQLVDMRATEKRKVFFPRGYYAAAPAQ